MQPTGNRSDKSEGLGSSSADGTAKSWKGEAGKVNSFAARGKCLYNYITWPTPLAESRKVQGKP